MKKQSIEDKLEELMSMGKNGSRFGDPDVQRAHDEEIQFLMHQQILSLKKKNNLFAFLSLFVAVISVSIAILK